MKIILLLVTVTPMLAYAQYDSASRSDAERSLSTARGINAGFDFFTVHFPKNWTRMDTNANGVLFTVLSDTSAGGDANVSLFSQTIDTTLDVFYARNKTEAMAGDTAMKVIGEGTRKLNGHDARWMHFSTTSEGKGYDGIVTIVFSKPIAYIITFTGLSIHYTRDKRDVDRILDSFQAK